MNAFEFIVISFVTVLTLSLWFTLGVVVFLGLIIRVSSAYAFSVFGAALTQTAPESPDRIYQVSNLWKDGLIDIVFLYKRRSLDAREPFVPSQWSGIFREVVGSTVVLVLYSSVYIGIRYFVIG